MKLYKGIAGKVRSTIEVTGNEDNIHTTHVATLSLGKQAVRLKTQEAVHIEEGDEVSVAGVDKSGIALSHAYYNHTQGVVGATGIGRLALMLVFGVLFTMLGAGLVINGFGNGSGIFGLVGAFFFLGGGYTAWTWHRHSTMRSMVMGLYKSR
jgi:hypothetical protein